MSIQVLNCFCLISSFSVVAGIVVVVEVTSVVVEDFAVTVEAFVTSIGDLTALTSFGLVGGTD